MKPAFEPFLDHANPHGWYRVSENLHEQALLLRSQNSGIDQHINHQSGEITYRKASNRASFLLGGFSLENAIKAFLVFQNPNWVSGGKLSKKIKSHKLTELVALCENMPLMESKDFVLSSFEDGIESWARYPCGLCVSDTRNEGVMDDDLWRSYENLIAIYHKELRNLLSTGWEGPDGYYSRFKFSNHA